MDLSLVFGLKYAPRAPPLWRERSSVDEYDQRLAKNVVRLM